MENKITNEEINLFNQNFVIKQTYRIEHEEEVQKLPNDFYKNNYLNDLDFEIDHFEPKYIDDSGRTFIKSKNTWNEYPIDNIGDIADFIKDTMPQVLEEEALEEEELYGENKPKKLHLLIPKNTNTKGYQPVTQI